MANESNTIFTIGQGARELDEFLEIIRPLEFDWFVDIRSVPKAGYRPEFSLDRLKPEVIRSGVKYTFMGDQLGGRPEDRSCYDEEDRVVYDFLENTKPFRAGIARLHNALSLGLRLCLMCSEGKPEECHRSKLIGKVLETEGVRVVHIDEHGEQKTQEEIVRRLDLGQERFSFCDSGFTSRGSYAGTK